jgi:DcuC family C4-dicarboxylate transporter
MDATQWLAMFVVAGAVVAVARGIDVRLALLVAALALGGLAADLRPILRTFLETFSSEKFIVPICTAMGFAYVLKHTGCDQELVRVLIEPVRRVRWFMIPGVVLVGFVVNIPVISQTSTAVCLGTVVVPVMRAAGFSMLAIGSTLLLGASVGGELFNPGAPELLTVKDLTGTSTTVMTQQYMPSLVLPMLAIAAAIFWVQTTRSERRHSHAALEEPVVSETAQVERLNYLKAAVPLVPLILLFLSGPPFNLVQVPQDWLAVASKEHPLPEKMAGSRLIGLAMMLGVAVAAAVVPRKSGGCMRAFFEGAGYGYAQIISLIVIANCFGKGIEISGLARGLKALIQNNPGVLVPLAGFVPLAFAFVSGSGMASTQSLYGFFFEATAGPPAEVVGNLTEAQTHEANRVGAMVGLGSAAGRTLSPVAAVTLMCAKLTDTKPADLSKRVAAPLLLGLAAVVVLRMLRVV